MNTNEISFIQRGDIEIIEGRGPHKFPFHTHESFMIGIILEGKADFRIGNQTKTLGKDEVYIVPSHVGISITPKSDIHYITVCIKGVYRYVLNGLYDVFYYIDIGVGLKSKIVAFINEEITEELFIQSIKDLVGPTIGLKNESVKRTKWIEQIKMYIEMHLQEPIRLDDLAKMAYVSKYHLVREFKKEMGVGPIQYVQLCKLRFLRQNIIKYSEIELAYKLHFSSQGHMCTNFKRYMGITPKYYLACLKEQ